MTTTVRINVGGGYVAHITGIADSTIEVTAGDGEKSFIVPHGRTIQISEIQIGSGARDEPAQAQQGEQGSAGEANTGSGENVGQQGDQDQAKQG